MASAEPSPPASPPASPEPELAQLRRKVEKLERELRSCKRHVREVEKLLRHTERLYQSAESNNQELRTQVRGPPPPRGPPVPPWPESLKSIKPRAVNTPPSPMPLEPAEQCKPVGVDNCLGAGADELQHRLHGLDFLSHWQRARLFIFLLGQV